QRADLSLQVGFPDKRLRPGTAYQVFLANNFTGAFDQSSQDVEATATEPHRLVALEQETLLCKELERAERDRVPIPGIARRIYLFLPKFTWPPRLAGGPTPWIRTLEI